MTDRVILEIDHEAVGQPANSVAQTKFGPRLYRPRTHKSATLKRLIQEAWKAKRQNRKATGAITVWIYCWFARPKSEIRKTLPMPSYRHTKKPDCDNISKLVLDALNKVAWVDDAQVALLIVEKRVCTGATPGSMQIIVEWEGDRNQLRRDKT